MDRLLKSIILTVALATCGCSITEPPATAVAPANGVAATEVRARSAVLWSRGDATGTMVATVSDDTGQIVASGEVALKPVSDFTGAVNITGLQPGTPYNYQVRLTSPGRVDQSASGRFRTASAASVGAAVRIAFGGDLAGQNVCRDAVDGFPIFDAISDRPVDIFLALGDIIYADKECEPTGALGNAQVPGQFSPSSSLDDFHRHWRYSFADAGFRRLRSRTAYYAVWDDHEVVNDFGPLSDRLDASGPSLMPLGRQAFLNFNPVSIEPQENTATARQRLFRRFRHGRHAEFFLLDTRQYRDGNDRADNASQPKSMLGTAQARWLVQSVANSSATWKFVVSSVPLSLPTGWPPEKGRDGWANHQGDTGFERELRGMLEQLNAAQARNLVWLSADVHFATGFEYTPFPDSPAFRVHEFVTGPLNAGLFPNHDLDMSLNPRRLYFYGPDTVEQTKTFNEAVGWFNLGYLTIDRDGKLQMQVINGRGESVQSVRLSPAK